MEAIREVVNKQIEIIENADADASAKEIARTDLGRYFDRFADKLDKTQNKYRSDESQNVTIPAIEAIVPSGRIQMLMILIVVQIIMMQQQIQC